jgi:hypothetical protein
VIDRGTGTLAQGRFRRSRTARPAAKLESNPSTSHREHAERIVPLPSESEDSEGFDDTASREDEQFRP